MPNVGASRHWVIGCAVIWVIGSLAGGDFFALRLLTPTLLRLSTLSSPAAERGLGKLKWRWENTAQKLNEVMYIVLIFLY
jgi:hypothetical protein